MTKTAPLMPKATALWLIQNTQLSFVQIAKFCGLHKLEVQNIADSDNLGIVPFDPVSSGQLTMQEIKRCEDDESAELNISKLVEADKMANIKRAKYVPIARRSDRPNAIAWVTKNYPTIPDNAVKTLLGTTTTMVHGIREKTYWNMHTVKPQNPVTLYLCTQEELDDLIDKYVKK